jgi:hypothetical protein
VPTTPRAHAPGEPLPAHSLLDLLAGFPASVVVGFEPDGRHVDLHVSPLPYDPRAGAAGLIGLCADESWAAAGVAVTGSAVTAGAWTAEDARAAVVVTRSGGMSSSISVGSAGPSSPAAGPACGLVVDSLHRMLGLPSPGGPPDAAALGVAMWVDRVLGLALRDGGVDWAAAAALHPALTAPARVAPSVETMVELTVRSASVFDWTRLHQRSSTGTLRTADLDPQEAAWMDTTMFARWVLGSLPDVPAALAVLADQGATVVADRIAAVVAGVARVIPGSAA